METRVRLITFYKTSHFDEMTRIDFINENHKSCYKWNHDNVVEFSSEEVDFQTFNNSLKVYKNKNSLLFKWIE